MECEDIPGTISQYHETTDRCNAPNIKKKLKDLSDAQDDVQENTVCSESLQKLKGDAQENVHIGENKDQHQEAIEPTTMYDETNGEIHEKFKFNHLETFTKISNLNTFFAWVVGFVVHNTWTYNNRTKCTKFIIIFGASIIIYSLLNVISEPTKLIEVFSIFGITGPAILKFNLLIKSRKQILSANLFVEEVFKLTTDGPKSLALKQHMDESFTKIKVFVTIQTMSLIVFACYPIYGFIVNNELIPLMPMQFPFLDQSTTFGFIVSNLIMLVMGIWSYFGFVAFDMYKARAIHNYIALVKLVQQDLLEFADMCKKSNKYSDEYKNEFLRSILMRIQDKDRYIQFINSIFAKIIFQQISVFYVCLTFTLYAIIRSNWYSGYGFLTFCLTEMWSLCVLGTSIKTENDNLCFAIYNMPWYEFPISTQKTLRTLLHSSQNAMELWIGPFAPLSVETGLKLTKSMYSSSTMIMNTSN